MKAKQLEASGLYQNRINVEMVQFVRVVQKIDSYRLLETMFNKRRTIIKVMGMRGGEVFSLQKFFSLNACARFFCG